MTIKLTRERIELIANFHLAMTLPPSHAWPSKIWPQRAVGPCTDNPLERGKIINILFFILWFFILIIKPWVLQCF